MKSKNNIRSTSDESPNLSGLTLIPISEVDITFDKSKTIGYDLTVKDNFTFLTHDGVAIEDTVSCNPILGDVENEECANYLDNMKSLVRADNTLYAGINTDVARLGAYCLTRY